MLTTHFQVVTHLLITTDLVHAEFFKTNFMHTYLELTLFFHIQLMVLFFHIQLTSPPSLLPHWEALALEGGILNLYPRPRELSTGNVPRQKSQLNSIL